MRRPLTYSLILHLGVVIAAILGLPSFRQPPLKEDQPVIVDLVAVREKANPPLVPQRAAKTEASKPPEAPAHEPEHAEARVEPRPESPEPRPHRPEARVEPRPEPQSKPEAPSFRAERPNLTAKPEPPSRPAETAPKPELREEQHPAPSRPEPSKPERAEHKPEPKPEAKPNKAPAQTDSKPTKEEAAPKLEPKVVAHAEPEPPARPKAPEPKAPGPKAPEPRAARPEAKPGPPVERKGEVHAAPQTERAPAKAAKPETAKSEEHQPEPASDFAAVAKAVQGLKGATASDRPSKPAQSTSSKSAASDGDPSFTSQMAQALKSSAPASNRPSLPVTSSEIDAVRRQIERCWNLPEGANEANLVVSIRVEMNPDGTPRAAIVRNAGQMQANPRLQATADSARRAVLNPRCHPFKFPPEKFEEWRTFIVDFNPKDIS